MAKTDTILSTTDLKKTYTSKKSTVEAVKGVSLDVKKGQIFGFLGPNGAGKTTSLQMLTTLLAPTSGQATVVGYDLLKNPEKIRQHIGYVSQAGGADSSTNAVENLILQGMLYGLSQKKAESRVKVLIQQFEMSEFAERKVASYSGGQKRRVDLALGIVHEPDILFLDEPTTGLDPQSRAHFWDVIRKIRKDGTTVFLTTHYLDEADNLCDNLAIIDHGTIVAEGTTENLKQQIGGENISIGIDESETIKKAKALLEKHSAINSVTQQKNLLQLYVKNAAAVMADVIRILDKEKVQFQTIELTKPTLDDVFLKKTGRSLREESS